MTEPLSLASLSPDSRSPGRPVAIAHGGRGALSWEDFGRARAALRGTIEARPEARWALHTEDHALFLLGFIALLECGKEIHLPPALTQSPPAAGGEPLPLLSDAPGAAVGLSLQSRAPDAGPGARQRIDPAAARIVFHTSGSTGAPKLVPKNLVQVENEIKVLAALWGDAFADAAVFSTVSPLHFYGFLFTALLPFSLGAPVCPERIRFPESLAELSGRKTVLVSSPAFLKRLGEGPALTAPDSAPARVFSSGGFLPETAARRSLAALGAPVHEIYGSTETGGIAWRSSPGDGAWTLFEGVTASGLDEAGFTVASSYLPPPGYMRIEDRIEVVGGAGDRSIRLLGRTDSIVKIEEKRVALNDVENRLYETGLVEDAVVLAFDDGRQYLAAAVALNAAGRERFRGRPKTEINRFFRDRLRAFFEPLVIPRKWRFPEAIPRNPQGKIDRSSARELLRTQPAARGLFAETAKVRVDEPEVLERDESPGKLALVLRFPPGYVHFQGHFPGLPILPAVAQVDWAMKFAHRHFGLPLLMKEISRFKCVKPIFPDARVKLELAWDSSASRLAFSYSDPTDGSLYSRGKIVPGDAE